MTEHIFEAVKHDLAALGHDITSHIHHTRYHATSTSTVPKGTPMALVDNILKDLTEGPSYIKGFAERLASYADDVVGAFGKADDLAVKIERYTQEPLVEDVLGVLEAVPGAREVLTPVLAGLKMLASGATSPGPSVSPAQPTVTAGVTTPASITA